VATVFNRARSHGYRLSAFERNDHDFYPTPADLVASLPIGLSRLGLGLPPVALDPCGGDGALRRGLAPVGVDVRLSGFTRISTRARMATSPADRSTRRTRNICNMHWSWRARIAPRSSPTRRTTRMRRASSSEIWLPS
jgi:hypothetical protein